MAIERFGFLALVMLAAFWPVLAWYASGSADASNDASGLLAAATVLLIVSRAKPQSSVRHPLLLPAVLLALYIAATLAALPIAVRAMLAFLALAALASAARLGKRLDLPLCVLAMLALPLAASLQFYCGYPLRVLAGSLSAVLLQLNGLGVVREGAVLVWGAQTVAIDAPCSGVKMLWASCYLTSALAALFRFTALKTVAAMLLALAAVVAANAIRAAALFYIETGLLSLPPWSHDAVGLVTFLFAAIMIVWGMEWIKA